MNIKNHLIEKYMGVERPGPDASCNERALFVEPNYHGSWNDLMPVVEAIANEPDHNVVLTYGEAIVTISNGDGSAIEIKSQADTNIESVYNMVIAYLEYLEEFNLPFQP